jgi:branched-chain amino acid transport system substrate-binding protein
MTGSRSQKWIMLLMVLLLLVPLVITCAPKQVEKAKIKIGIIGPMKFHYGEHFSMGAQLAADEINAMGGLAVGDVKYGIELVKADSNEVENIPDAVSAMERLITMDKVNFVVGGWRSEAVMAMQEVAADHKVIHLTNGCAASEVAARIRDQYGRYKYCFRPQPGNTAVFLVPLLFTLLDVGAREVREELGIEKPKVAMVIDKVMAFDPLVKAINSVAAGLGVEIVGTWRPSNTATDLTGELTGIKAAGAQIILTGLAGPSGVPFSKQWGELQIPAMVVGGNMMAQKREHWETTSGFCNYEVTAETIAHVKRTDKTIPYWDKFEKTFKQVPTAYSTLVYDGFYILKDAIERADTLDSDTLVVSLEKTDYIGVLGRYVLNGPDSKYPHDPEYGPEYLHWYGLQWRDGKLMTVWPDGQPAMRDDRWKGVKYEGTVDVQIPPWVKKYWQGKS